MKILSSVGMMMSFYLTLCIPTGLLLVDELDNSYQHKKIFDYPLPAKQNQQSLLTRIVPNSPFSPLFFQSQLENLKEPFGNEESSILINSNTTSAASNNQLNLFELNLQATHDTYISSTLLTNQNYGNCALLFLKGPARFSREPVQRSILKFDLTSLPANAIISEAIFYATVIPGNSPIATVRLHELLESWNEGNGDCSGSNGGTDWNSWSQDGGNYASASVNRSVGGPITYNWDITNLAKAWQTNPSSNHGFLLRLQDEEADLEKLFASSEYGTPSKRPKLILKYYFPMELSADITPTSCFYTSDGAIDINVTNGLAPYTYTWSNGTNSEDLQGLAAGSTYQVLVTDNANNQIISPLYTIENGSLGDSDQDNDGVSDACDVTVALTSKQELECSYDSNGRISIKPEGGTPPYSYRWTNYGSTGYSDPKNLTNLPPGTYTITVRDQNFILSNSLTVTLASSTGPDSDGDGVIDACDVEITVLSTFSLPCTYSSGGVIYTNVAGGTPPYQLRWTQDGSNQIISTSNDLTNLYPGTYTLTVTDANGISSEITETIAMSSTGIDSDFDGINDDCDILVSLASKQNLICAKDFNGSVDINVTGGTPPYRYDWIGPGFNEGVFDSQDLSGVATGAYRVLVTDVNNLLTELTLTLSTSSSGPDTDGDGIRDDCDEDDDNDGIIDSRELIDHRTSNKPETFVFDPDNDRFYNHLDLDSDGDGIYDIIEAGGRDTNSDGRVDNFIDTNYDGIKDNLGQNGLSLIDSDGDGFSNHVDNDSDNDGIVDLIEAQASDNYKLPVNARNYGDGYDHDDDGIDDQFDNDCNSCGNSNITGTPIDPIDTDGDGIPDYLDSDSDGDGKSDFLEANDFDNDGIADVNPTSADEDYDGILDVFDYFRFRDPVRSSSNNRQSPQYFPDHCKGQGELDWREIPCEDCNVTLAPSGQNITAQLQCLKDGWTYYSASNSPNDLLFAIEHTPSAAGGNTNLFTVNATITVSNSPVSPEGVYKKVDTEYGRGIFIMGRYINFNLTSGSLNGFVNVSFFYGSDESGILASEAENWKDEYLQTPYFSDLQWFTMASGSFSPDAANVQIWGIEGAIPLVPVADQVPVIDSQAFSKNVFSRLENDITFTTLQLRNLTSLGLAYSVGAPYVVLPVELTDFSLKRLQDQVSIEWRTATEVNNDYFTLYRSTDGQNWQEIRRLAGKGSTSQESRYEVFDATPANGINYYKLQQTDFDGTTKELGIKTIHLSIISDLKVYPNPVKDFLYLNLMASEKCCFYTVYGPNGQEYLSGQLEEGQIKIDLNSLLEGIYIVELRHNHNIQQKRFKIIKE